MTRRPALFIIVGALIGTTIFITLGRFSRHQLRIVCYFQNAGGLKVGATVAIAGVRVGSVTSVRVRPEMRDHPAEVTMLLQTSYELKIPNDAVAMTETEGVLGEEFVEIDIHNAKGPPLTDGGTLATLSNEGPTLQQLLDCISNVAEHRPCRPEAKPGK